MEENLAPGATEAGARSLANADRRSRCGDQQQKGHVMRSRKWWLITYRDVTLDGGAIVTKTKREKLTEVLPEHG